MCLLSFEFYAVELRDVLISNVLQEICLDQVSKDT